MIKNITCIACPQGCDLTIEIKNNKVLKVSGNKCQKGFDYAKQEIESPLRTVTSTVFGTGLPLKMIPVKTSKPIPKDKVMPLMKEIRKIKVKKSVKCGEVLKKNILNLDVDLVATRDIS
jgi:CxxC motif-containing protein